MVDQGGSSNKSVRIYTNSSFELDGTTTSTDTITLHLRVTGLPPSENSTRPQVLLKIGNATGDSLNVSLDSLNFLGLGVQQCSGMLSQQQQTHTYIPLTVMVQSPDSHVIAGDYRYSIVANFTSTDSTIEDDLRRDADMANVLSVMVNVRDGE